MNKYCKTTKTSLEKWLYTLQNQYKLKKKKTQSFKESFHFMLSSVEFQTLHIISQLKAMKYLKEENWFYINRKKSY